MSDAPQGFDATMARLEEIADEVSAEGVSLDEALSLYEEAVRLGLAACDVSEADVLAAEDGSEPAEEGSREPDAPAQEQRQPGDGQSAAEPAEPDVPPFAQPDAPAQEHPF